MAARGVDALTDRELLSLLTEDEQSAEALLAAYGGSLARIGSEEAARLRMIGGLGLRRARMLLAAAELGRRITAARAAETDVVSSSDDVVRLFRPQLETLSHEECWAVYLTSSNRIIERQRVSQGGVQGTVVDHRLIILCNCTIIILYLSILTDCVHNLHTIGYIAKAGVFTVQERTVLMYNKKLGACTVLHLGTCHGNGASCVR